MTVLARCTIWIRCVYLHMSHLCDMRKSLEKTLSVAWNGTRMALTSPYICPLCSASSKHGLEMTVKQLLSRKVCQIGSTNFSRESRQTKSSSQPKVLSLILESCSKTALSNSWRRSNSWSSIVSWISSPASVVKIRCKTIDLSSLHCELVIDMLSAVVSSWLGSVHLSSSLKVLRLTTTRLTCLIVTDWRRHNCTGSCHSPFTWYYCVVLSSRPPGICFFGCLDCHARIGSRDGQCLTPLKMHWLQHVGGVG